MSYEEISKQHLVLEERSFSLTYLLVATPCDSELKSYGIAIKLSDMDDTPIDSCLVSDVCCNKDELVAFIRKLADGTATPISLKDLVEDYVVQRSEA